MTGPFDDVFGNTPFDLNRDGHIDAGEWSLINDTLFSDEIGLEEDEEEELEDELELAGLDRDELGLMDPDERREAIEDAGLDADDFDDFDF